MLTKDLVIFEYERGERVPDRLTMKVHGEPYLDRAAKMLALYENGVGRRRNELHASVEELFDGDPHYHPTRVKAFCKLLDDASDFDGDRAGKAESLRAKVFVGAAEFYPLVEKPRGLFGSARSTATDAIAKKLRRPWDEIEDSLFDDVLIFQKLRSFSGYPSPKELLARYNVAQLQGVLYEAQEMKLTVTKDLKRIVSFAKLAGLMHSITHKDGVYTFRFTGPATVLRETRRYGVMMSRFIPGLLSCTGWNMHVQFQSNNRPSYLRLDSKCGLSSPVLPGSEFDSSVEQALAEKWGTEARDGWRLAREADVLHSAQKTFVPDFTLTHESGKIVYMEIVGFWTSDYLAEKRNTLSTFSDLTIIAAVAERTAEALNAPTEHTITYKTGITLAAVMKVLSQLLPESG